MAREGWLKLVSADAAEILRFGLYTERRRLYYWKKQQGVDTVYDVEEAFGSIDLSEGVQVDSNEEVRSVLVAFVFVKHFLPGYLLCRS